MVIDERIPVTVSDIKVTCHDDCIVQVNGVLSKEVERSLITIGIYVNNEVSIPVTVKRKDVDIPVVDNIKSHCESHF